MLEIELKDGRIIKKENCDFKTALDNWKRSTIKGDMLILTDKLSVQGEQIVRIEEVK